MDQRIRVLYIDCSVGFGGAVKSLALTLRGLPLVEKFILTSQDPEIVNTWFAGLRVSSFRRLINYRNRDRIHDAINHPGLRSLALKGFAATDRAETLKNLLRLYWVIRRHRIDIIHLNNGFLPPEAMRAAGMTAVPCIVHLRNFQEEEISGSLSRSVAHVITVSNAVADSVSEKGIRVPAVTTIHDPVDVEQMTQATEARERIRRQHGLAAREIAVGIFGRVIPWKGQLEFVEAMIIAVQGNELLRAVIVGDESDGNRSYFDAIRRRIRDADMDKAFILTGYRQNVEEYYAAVDIVVHASITPEPFGMVVPEAMAARRPVIAANAGGPREVIEHGIDGLLFPPGDVDALASAISTLAANTDLRARMAAAGAAKAAARFSIASKASRIAAVYEAVLQAARGSSR